MFDAGSTHYIRSRSERHEEAWKVHGEKISVGVDSRLYYFYLSNIFYVAQ